jgi:hypothetical protein
VRLRVLSLVAVAVLAAAAAAALLGRDEPAMRPARPSALLPPGAPGTVTPRPAPAAEAEPAPPAEERPATGDPFAYDPDEAERFTRLATAGHAHPLYAVVPGGAPATAARVARWRRAIEATAEEHDLDPDTLEGMVYLESAGYPEARAGGTQDAVGLTQILAETGSGLLGMRVDVAESARLTRRIARADARGRTAVARRLRARRAVVDQRYDPQEAIAAMGRYLAFARGELDGREDLAVVSYHMGVGNLTDVRERFGADEDTPYAELFFDSSPLRNPRTWALLDSFGDDSKTYLWRVLAARDVMARWRDDPAALAARAARITAKNSREELLHPIEATVRFEDARGLRAAYASGDLIPLDPATLAAAGLRIGDDMGELARRDPELYRGLRPEALALLVYLGRGVAAAGGGGALTVTSTVRDARYQAALRRRNREATPGYSLHTTGWAFDVLRRYRSGRQARAFQFVLDRLTALDLIAYVVEPAAIHVTVSPRARALLG